MEDFHQALLFPNERQATTNVVMYRVAGLPTHSQRCHIPNVFSRKEFAKFATSTAKEVWGFMSWLGNMFITITVYVLHFRF